MAKNLINSLISYGLTNNEASIYVCLLTKLEASAFEIAKNTGISRATVYITLEKMRAQKLVSLIKKNNVQYFTPESPSRLKALAEDKVNIIKEILPELGAIINTDKEKPNIKMYTGADGVILVLEDILETMHRKNIHSLLAVSRSEILDKMPSYFPDWLKRREKLGVATKLILPEAERTKHVFDANAMREVRYLPNDFNFKAMVEIYGNKMAIFSLKENEMYSVVIDSEPMVQTITQLFLFVWEKLLTVL